MAEYISREKAIKELREVYEQEYPTASGDFDEYASHDVPNILRNMKAADVQPVKHGEWDFQGYQLFKCTNCKEIFTQNQLEAMQNHINQEEFTFPNFCPNCGARMIKDGDTE